MNERRFAGKIAVVTGAAAGIGYACVERLAAEGAQVILTDRHSVRGVAAAAKLSAEGLAVEFFYLDAGDGESWRNLAAHIREGLGKAHILVNNAFSGVAATFDEITPEGIQDAMRVNAAGALIGMQLISALMTDGGAIVNVSSIAAFYPSRSNLGYSTAKMALVQLTGSAALALGKRGPQIRVNSVAPGAINTRALQTSMRAINGLPRDADVTGVLKKHASNTMLDRVGEPAEVAAAICFLASDDASYITGQCLRVDGGIAQ